MLMCEEFRYNWYGCVDRLFDIKILWMILNIRTCTFPLYFPQPLTVTLNLVFDNFW